MSGGSGLVLRMRISNIHMQTTCVLVRYVSAESVSIPRLVVHREEGFVPSCPTFVAFQPSQVRSSNDCRQHSPSSELYSY